MDEYDKIIVGWILGIITMCLGAWLNDCFAERRNRRSEFRKAAIEFKSSFTNILVYLCDDPVVADDIDEGITHIGQFLSDSYPNILRAKMSFVINLGTWKRFWFNKAWEKYIYPQKNKKDREYGFEFDNYSKMSRTEAKKLALKKIEKILSYAKL